MPDSDGEDDDGSLFGSPALSPSRITGASSTSTSNEKRSRPPARADDAPAPVPRFRFVNVRTPEGTPPRKRRKTAPDAPATIPYYAAPSSSSSFAPAPHFNPTPTRAPRASSLAPPNPNPNSNSKPKPTKKKPSKKSTRAQATPPRIDIPIPSSTGQPLPPNFLRNQPSLLGRAGIASLTSLGSIRPSHRPRAGTSSENPIVLCDDDDDGDGEAHHHPQQVGSGTPTLTSSYRQQGSGVGTGMSVHSGQMTRDWAERKERERKEKMRELKERERMRRLVRERETLLPMLESILRVFEIAEGAGAGGGESGGNGNEFTGVGRGAGNGNGGEGKEGRKWDRERIRGLVGRLIGDIKARAPKGEDKESASERGRGRYYRERASASVNPNAIDVGTGTASSIATATSTPNSHSATTLPDPMSTTPNTDPESFWSQFDLSRLATPSSSSPTPSYSYSASSSSSNAEGGGMIEDYEDLFAFLSSIPVPVPVVPHAAGGGGGGSETPTTSTEFTNFDFDFVDGVGNNDNVENGGDDDNEDGMDVDGDGGARARLGLGLDLDLDLDLGIGTQDPERGLDLFLSGFAGDAGMSTTSPGTATTADEFPPTPREGAGAFSPSCGDVDVAAMELELESLIAGTAAGAGDTAVQAFPMLVDPGPGSGSGPGLSFAPVNVSAPTLPRTMSSRSQAAAKGVESGFADELIDPALFGEACTVLPAQAPVSSGPSPPEDVQRRAPVSVEEAEVRVGAQVGSEASTPVRPPVAPAPAFASTSASVSTPAPTPAPTLLLPHRAAPAPAKPFDKSRRASVLSLARARKEQLERELERSAVEMWECTIEAAALVHVRRELDVKERERSGA